MIFYAADVLGFVFLMLGLGYLYRPRLISRVVAAIRDTLLNDAHIALDRKKWGLFFLLLSLLSFYLGIAPQR
jgi:hypothetical protein